MTNRSKAIDRLKTLQSTEVGGAPIGADAGDGVGFSADVDSPLALRAAQSNCTLLITGETGVGKGYLARWVHEHSTRHSGPFIPVNCGAIPETLVDSQLFGHARGAFSGASHDHIGLVRAAEKGSLLLDEVSELPASAQTRLLRLLQDREVQPVGYSKPVVVDVRIIAATNIDLKRAVTERRFREDLLFRLDVIRLHVRPLRQRLGELSGLICTFNRELAALYQQPELAFTNTAMEYLHGYSWPGNIRQVRSLLERLHVLCPGETIDVDQIINVGQLTLPPADGLGRMMLMDQIKQDRIRQVLAESGGSISRAARMFGVHRSTIYRWLRGI